jgi:deazaflavin-dependent oxidoreductase (nitroreductase family)
VTQAPTIIRLSNPITRAMLRLGLPMGPNTLLTVRGRTSGLPRTAPVAVVEIDDRRWIIGAYGEVQWVRNLRAAGEADIRLHGRTVHVTATELDRSAAVVFYRDTLADYVRRLPPLGQRFVGLLFGLIGREVLSDPERAAATRPVFELGLV